MKKPKDNNGVKLEQKWGKDALSRGWTGVPNVLIERQQALGLNPTEMNILLILMKFWWASESIPFPSKRSIGEMIGRDESTIRKCIANLEKKGLIKRESQFLELGGQTSNKYAPDGLVKRLQKEAVGLNKLKESRLDEDAKFRRGAKLPHVEEEL